MKKVNSLNQDRKVIPFPNLQNRLTEKGMDFLQQKNFKEALNLLEQANEIEFQSDVELGIILCFVEMGNLDVAKERCKNLLNEELHDYFQVLHVYVTILLQQGMYDEIQSTLEAVFKENKLPVNYAESLNKILDFSKNMNKDRKKDQSVSDIAQQEYEKVNKCLNISNNVKEQWQIIQTLRTSDVRQLLPLLKEFLANSAKNPMLKTIILELLKEHDINIEVNVEKFGFVQSLTPSKSPNILDQSFPKEVLSLLEEMIGNENPTLFEVTKEIWLRHLFVLYPLLPKPEQPPIWAAAVHKLGCEMQGIDTNQAKIEVVYGVSPRELEECYKNLLKIEEISLLQI